MSKTSLLSKWKIPRPSLDWSMIGLLAAWVGIVVVVMMVWVLSDSVAKYQVSLSPAWDQGDRVEELVATIVANQDRSAAEKLESLWSSSLRDADKEQLVNSLKPEQVVYARLMLVDQGLQIQPAHGDLLAEKVVLLTRLGRWSEAEETLKQLRGYSTKDKLVDELGLWLREMTE